MGPTHSLASRLPWASADRGTRFWQRTNKPSATVFTVETRGTAGDRREAGNRKLPSLSRAINSRPYNPLSW